jgi:hypothetical protein
MFLEHKTGHPTKYLKQEHHSKTMVIPALIGEKNVKVKVKVWCGIVTGQVLPGEQNKKTLDLRSLMKEAESRANTGLKIDYDKDNQSYFLKAFEALAQADDKNYASVLKSLR